MRTLILSLGICLLSIEPLWSCTCAASSFCETSASASLVAVVSIKQNFDDLNAVEAKVLDLWKGANNNPSRFMVFGGTWADFCGPNPRIMKEGEKWVLALSIASTETHPNEPSMKGQFFLPTCSNSLLQVEEGRVKGRILEGLEIQEFSLDRFKRKLNECAFPKVFIAPIEQGIKITTETPSPDERRENTWEVVLRDIHGREIRKILALKEEFSLVLLTDDLPKGLYLLQVYLDGNTRIFKGILGR